jgi:hypothetical protein
MDEMQLLREFAIPSELPKPAELAQARARLVAATIRAGESGAVRPFRRRRQIVRGGITAIGLAAAVAAAIVLAPGDNAVPPSPVPRAQTANDPVRILYAAAAMARAQPDVEPRPDQFVYTKTRSADGREAETWASADGTHDGLQILLGHEHEIEVAGCRDGKRVQKESQGRVVTSKCVPRPAFIPDLPTNADDMLAYLHKSTYGEDDTLHDLGSEVVDLAGGYLRPAARAALYEAVAKIPGLVVRNDAKDGAGRSVIGLTWNSTTPQAIGNQAEFLFDPVTFAFLGEPTYGSVVSQGIVDKVRQLP